RIAFANGLRWFLSILFGGLGRFTPKSLLDNSPLRQLLEAELRLQNIQGCIDAGILHAFSITAAAYYSGHSVTFYQGHDAIRPWKRTRRIGIPRPITMDHLMASVAIPILFPAVRIGYEYYGDGSMRQLAPLSSALHLGAERLLVIGIRNERPDDYEEIQHRLVYPTLGHVSGYILDTLFMDSLSMDLERLKRINHTLSHIQRSNRKHIPLRQIDLVTIFPSQDIRPITERHIHLFPNSVQYLFHGIGAANRSGRPLMSYLLFEEGFCRELIDLGYHDAMRARRKILRLLGSEETQQAPHASR
nr:patatin-like phospholipase family protein [Pseudomonadota bacterium]